MRWRRAKGRRKWKPVPEPLPVPPAPEYVEHPLCRKPDVVIRVDGGMWLATDPPRPVGSVLSEREVLVMLRMDALPNALRSLARLRDVHGLRAIAVPGGRVYLRADVLAFLERCAAPERRG